MSDDAPATAAGERRPVPEDEPGEDHRPPPTEDEDEAGTGAEADGDADEPRRSPPRTGRRRGRPSRARGRPLSSDEAAFRWTVRGVPVHVRTIALKAADERGMTVGDWLAEAIVAFARSGGLGSGPAPEPRSNLPATESPPDLMEMVRSIDRRLTALEERQPAEERRPAGLLSRIFGGRGRQT